MRSEMKSYPHAEIGLPGNFRRPLQLVVMMSIMSLASHCLAGEQESLPNWWRSVRDCNTKYHPWTPPATLEEWQALQPALKTQIQLSQGLWPLPERTPLNPVVHGRIEGDDYIIEKVWFESFPGLVVTGNLYRPKTITGKVPAILNPHGHWPNGRFYDAGDGQADAQIKQGAEKDSAAAHSPLQARMVHLARMGCIAFHYDMIGYADQKPIDHRANFITAQDGQWLIENMGLQTWNSIRALDYLCTLPEVDQSRLAVTGSSGGGTQTMLVAALDDRIQVSVPAVMVSTAMQGGCVCENSPYLRIDSNNIAIAAVFAPKPQGLIGANDWTIHLEKTGLPELKSLYGLYRESDKIAAWVHPEFQHNYNLVNRTHMYAWMAQYLGLEDAPLEERPFPLRTQEELTVFDAEHPIPSQTLSPDQLRVSLIERFSKTYQQLCQPDQSAAYKEVIGAAANTILGARTISSQQVVSTPEFLSADAGGDQLQWISHRGEGFVVPVRVARGNQNAKRTVIAVSAAGTELPEEEVSKWGAEWHADAVVLASLSRTGTNQPSGAGMRVDEKYYGYTSCYNWPLISQQVRELMLAVLAVRKHAPETQIVLAGRDDVAIAALLTQSLLSDLVSEADLVLSAETLRSIKDVNDPLFLPGSARYGGFPGLAAVSPCPQIRLRNVPADRKAEFEILVQRAVECQFVD